jgi:chromosome segregation ATPase
MAGTRGTRSFAPYLLVALAVVLTVGISITFSRASASLAGAKTDASTDAKAFASHLTTIVTPEDLVAPVSIGRAKQLSDRILAVMGEGPTSVITIYRQDGTVVFSTDRNLLGEKEPVLRNTLRTTLQDGSTSAVIGDTFATRVALTPQGSFTPVAVAEIDRPYGPIWTTSVRTWRIAAAGLALALMLTLGLLYRTIAMIRRSAVANRSFARLGKRSAQDPTPASKTAANAPDYLEPAFRLEADAREEAEKRAAVAEERANALQEQYRTTLEELQETRQKLEGASPETPSRPDPEIEERLLKAEGRVRLLEGQLQATKTERDKLALTLKQPAKTAVDPEFERQVRRVEQESIGLRAELEGTRTELVATAKERDALREVAAEAAELKTQFQAVRDEAETSRNQLDAAQRELDAAKSELENMRSELVALRVEEQRATELERALDEAKLDVENVSGEATALRGQIDEIKVTAKAALDEAKANAQSELEVARADADADLVRANASLATLQSTLDEVRATAAAEAEELRVELTRTHGNASEETERARQEAVVAIEKANAEAAAEAERQVAAIQSELEAVRSELDEARARLGDAETLARETVAEAEAAAERAVAEARAAAERDVAETREAAERQLAETKASAKAELEAQRQTAKAALEQAKTTARAKIQETKEAGRAKLAAAQDEARQRQEDLNLVQAQIGAVQAELEGTHQELGGSRNELAAALTELATAHGELQTTRDLIDELQAGMADGTRSTAEEMAAAREEARSLQAQLTESAARIAETEEQLTQMQMQLVSAEAGVSAELQGEIERQAELTSRADAAEKDLVGAVERATSAESDAVQLRVRADELEHEIEQLMIKHANAAADSEERADLEEVLRLTQERLAGNTDKLAEMEARTHAAEAELQAAMETIEELQSAVRVAEMERAAVSLHVAPVMDDDLAAATEAAVAEGQAAILEDRRAAAPFMKELAMDAKKQLTSILGLTLTLKHKKAPNEQAPLLRQLAMMARRLDHTVGDLVEADQLARGTIELRVRRTNLEALIHRVVEESQISTEHDVRLDTEELVLSVDPVRTEQIVSGLLRGAVDRTPPGSAITVRLAHSRGGVIISVEDMETSSDASLSPVVARFADVQGGWAKVEGRPNGGSAFRVFLPDHGAEGLDGDLVDGPGDEEADGADRPERLTDAIEIVVGPEAVEEEAYDPWAAGQLLVQELHQLSRDD